MTAVVEPGSRAGNGTGPADGAKEPVARMPQGLTTRASPRSSDSLTVTVVVPTLNEAPNIPWVLERLQAFDDIVIVDGHSSDGTVEVALQIRPDLTVIQRMPRGKGDAMRAGLDAARGDILVVMDADGSMDTAEIDVFTSMIGVGFDLVKGSRYAVGGGSHDMTRVRSFGNGALCLLANTLYGTRWTDLCYGYLAFRRDCLPRLALTADGFEIESQILAHAALAGLRMAEIPSVEMPRITGVSHLNARRDGLRVARELVTSRYAPRMRRAAASLRPIDSPTRH